MSELTIQRATHSRALSVLALLGLGCWAAMTFVIGAGSVLSGVHTVSAYAAPSSAVSDPLLPGQGVIALSAFVFVFWILSLNIVLVAAVLGVVDIAVTHRSWRRPVTFAAVAVAGPVVALVVSQIGTGDDLSVSTSYLEAVAPGSALVVMALGTFVAAWWLLDVPFSVRSATPRSAS